MRSRAVAMPVLVAVLLAGCASSGQGAAPAGSATLTVHVGVFGGPMLPDGKMAASNAPKSDAAITVTDAGGHTRRAETNSVGVATFSLIPGRYTVHGPCGFTPRPVQVRRHHRAHVQVPCNVP